MFGLAAIALVHQRAVSYYMVMRYPPDFDRAKLYGTMMVGRWLNRKDKGL